MIYLDSHTFVFVADFDIVDPDIGTPKVNSIETTFVSTPNYHIVDFSIRASV